MDVKFPIHGIVLCTHGDGGGGGNGEQKLVLVWISARHPPIWQPAKNIKVL